ncbi:predicted protein [Nematostella vectensis]|uniref:ShKT domain-containing protein n=1 Tax=Nematostella vectensis TaxID=45351 RepID=A7RW24_NEMVE|nr:predicted protein [Nematostella vectensis]|eukprot:XP_001636442.1 predicted protein [Nematostella vectensis]
MLKNFLADMLRYDMENDESTKRTFAFDEPCENFRDVRPNACKELAEMDKHYCSDYPSQAKRFCKRTCSPCGPAKEKAPGPSAECEDLRNDCKFMIPLYRKAYNQDPCVTYPSYTYKYCRKFCSQCIGPIRV